MNQVIGKRNGRVRDGELRNGWESKRIGDILQLEYGKPLPKSERHPDGLYPVYGANGEKSRSNRFYFDRSTIIVGRKGSAGEVTLTESKFWPLDVTYFVTFDDSKFDLAFLYHLLSTLELPRLAKGVKPGINRNDIYSLQANVPPLPEQRRIVAILDEAFAGIAAARANAERNLRNARGLFESHLEGVFSRRGEGWVERRLGDIAKTQYGLSKAMNTDREGFKIFRMGEIQDGGLHDTGEMKYVNIDSTGFRKYKLNVGDILFNRTNSYELVGKTGIFDLKGDYCFASYLIRVLLDTSIMRPEFLNYFMNSDRFQQSVKRKASKSINQANINATILSNELIPFPESHDEQQATVIQLNSLREQTQNLQTLYQRKLAALDELKKSLLDRAFSGRL